MAKLVAQPYLAIILDFEFGRAFVQLLPVESTAPVGTAIWCRFHLLINEALVVS